MATASPGMRGPRIGLRFELRSTREAGLVERAATSEHVLMIHAGPPVRVMCQDGLPALCTRGDIHVLPAGASVHWTEDDGSDTIDIGLPTAVVRLAAQEMGLDPDRAGLEPQYHLRDSQIEHIGWALEAEYRAGFPNGLVYRESLGMALAVHLVARYGARVLHRGGLTQEQLRRVTDYVELHLAQDVSLLRLARVAGVSASHFRSLFKRSMGVPVHQYVIQRRVERARLLLERGHHSPSQVALDAGFSHQSHMARCMRRVLGVTPRFIGRARPQPASTGLRAHAVPGPARGGLPPPRV
jgi:AraC family transcriptional regulator